MIKEYKARDIITMYNSAQNATLHARGVLAFVLNHNIGLMKQINDDTIAKRDEIIRKYADNEDELGRASISDPEKLEKANKEYADYLDLEFSLDIVVLPESKLTDANLSAADMNNLKWMIKLSTSDDIRAILGIVDEEAEEAAKKEALKYDPKAPMDDDRF